LGGFAKWEKERDRKKTVLHKKGRTWAMSTLVQKRDEEKKNWMSPIRGFVKRLREKKKKGRPKRSGETEDAGQKYAVNRRKTGTESCFRKNGKEEKGAEK